MKTLIKDAYALLDVNGRFLVEKADILIEDEIIKYVNNIPSDLKIDKTILGKNKLVIPGLINAHTHSYMTLFRNVADDLPFHKWLFENILPLEDKLTSEDCYWGSMLGIMEMLSTGTTCFNDMYMFINETSKAVSESGIRANLTRGLTGENSFQGNDRRINEALEEINYWKGKNERLTFSFGPHAPYSCGPDYLKSVGELSSEYGIGTHIHLSESINENNQIMSEYNMTPTEYISKNGILSSNTLLAHCVHLNESDMKIISSKNSSIVSCPVSNLKLGNGFADVPRIMNHGINVCLGTDGPASNNSLNMFREMQFMSLIHKGTNQVADLITAEECLKFATINGAKALNLDKKIGAIKEGYKADLCIIDVDKPQCYPHNNILSSLVYSMNGTEVETVMVNGNILFDKGIFLTMDREKIIYETQRIANRILGK